MTRCDSNGFDVGLGYTFLLGIVMVLEASYQFQINNGIKKKIYCQDHMSEIAQMDKLMRQDVGFVDYLSLRHRGKELARIEQRIQALQNAKASLESTSITRIPKKRYKNAQHWCKCNDWTDEDAMYFMHDYAKKRSTFASSSTNVSGMLSGISRVGQALIV